MHAKNLSTAAAAAAAEAAEAAAVAPAVREQQRSPEERKKVDKELLAAADRGDEEGVRDALARGAQPNGDGANDVRYLVFVL